jgi:malate dehydrogenase (oxaloacetate-decarboxylating)(NADP+)
MLVDEKIGFPILVGRPEVIHQRIKSLSLRLEEGKDYTIVDPNDDLSYQKYWTAYNHLTIHHGISPDIAKVLFRTNTTIIAALMVHLGDADTLLCGMVGRYIDHFQHLQQILGVQDNVNSCATLSALVIDHQPLFVCDPCLAVDPTAEQLVEMALLSAKQIQRFGITPKVALVSHSNFGSSHSSESAHKMRVALKMLIQAAPDLEVEGEMHADVALCPALRKEIFPHSKLEGRANLLIMPTIDAANISLKMAKSLVDELVIGPILMGIRGSAQILSPTMSVREIIDITTLAIVDALEMSKGSTTDALECRHGLCQLVEKD